MSKKKENSLNVKKRNCSKMFRNPAINRIYNSLDTKGLTNKEPVFPTLRCQFTSLEGNLFRCLHDGGYVSLDTDKRSFEWL